MLVRFVQPLVTLCMRVRAYAIEIRVSATVEDRDTTHLHRLAARLGDTLSTPSSATPLPTHIDALTASKLSH